jgi:hypothetical protein
MNFAYRLVKRPPDAIFWIAAVVTVLGAAFDLLTDRVLLGYVRYTWGVADVRDPVLHTALAAAVSLFALWGLYLVLDRRRSIRDPEMKSSFNLVLGGGVLTLGAVMMLNVIIPDVFGVADFPRYGSVAMGLFIFFVFLAVNKYGFLSISVNRVAHDLFRDIRDGIVLIDNRKKVLRMNRSAASIHALASRCETCCAGWARWARRSSSPATSFRSWRTSAIRSGLSSAA